MKGLLEELKQQAEKLKQEQDSGRAVRLQNLQVMQTGLQEARRYLGELANALNILKPAVYRSYYVDMANRLDQLAQCEYAVREKQRTLNSKDYLEEVAFGFRCVGTRNLTIEKTSMEGVNRLREYLWAYNIRFECREVKSERGLPERGTFTIFAEVPASATFAGNWDTGEITLTLKNIERPGVVEYQYEAFELNVELFEELASFLLGRPNRLRQLGGYQQMIRSTTRPLAVARDDMPPDAPQLAAGSASNAGALGFVNALLKK
jgi:hypothetical protein